VVVLCLQIQLPTSSFELSKVNSPSVAVAAGAGSGGKIAEASLHLSPLEAMQIDESQ
jgi:hypothetical protein